MKIQVRTSLVLSFFKQINLSLMELSAAFLSNKNADEVLE